MNKNYLLITLLAGASLTQGAIPPTPQIKNYRGKYIKQFFSLPQTLSSFIQSSNWLYNAMNTNHGSGMLTQNDRALLLNDLDDLTTAIVKLINDQQQKLNALLPEIHSAINAMQGQTILLPALEQQGGVEWQKGQIIGKRFSMVKNRQLVLSFLKKVRHCSFKNNIKKSSEADSWILFH